MQKVTRHPLSLVWAAALTLLGASVLYLRAHSQPPGTSLPAAPGEFTPEVKIEIQNGFRTITSNGIPDHPTGVFPNRGNPNYISPQSYRYRMTMTPKLAGSETRTRIFGVAVNGVPFDPGTAELWNNSPRWHYEALSGLLHSRGGLGVDSNLAHVQPNGAYHYHGLPMGLLKKLNFMRRMALVGYAVDGFPIYGPYAYTNAADPKSPLKKLDAAYRLKEGMRPVGADSPGGAYDGSFESDYEYVKGLSDLDTTNGRTGVTPEYPEGTYYYVLTENWPFVPRSVRGTPDPSFNQRGPGGPGGGREFQGGPGGGQHRPGGPPNGLVPASALGAYLGLTDTQEAKLEALVKTMDALNRENFAIPAFAELKLADEQIRKIAAGGKLSDVLTTEQKKVLAARKRPGFDGPGRPGGFGGPGPGGPGQAGPP